MTPSKRCWVGLRLLVKCAAVSGAIPIGIATLHAVFRDCALAQIAPDGTLGIERTQVTSKRPGDFQIDGGAMRGTNLFHSFKQFSVPTGGSVYFHNEPNIQDIFSRVTGGSISNIDGLIRANGTANLFLLNPNGIIFGPNASLKIGGSFLASTASSFNFADGTQFSATAPQTRPLLTISVPLGVQFGMNQPGAISNAGNLAVGQNLTLSGGSVVSTGQLVAPAGQVTVTAVSGDASVRQLQAQTATLSAVHDLTLTPGTQLHTTGDLILSAQNAVWVRDNVEHPFIAQAGGNLYIQGNQGIDIRVLNHPETPFQSGGNLSLVSGGNVSGDAHFASGGNFSILNLARGSGKFVSLYDPIIRSNGDVTIGDYKGASLKIESGGNITTGTIEIVSPDLAAAGDPESSVLTGNAAVILRAGVHSLSGNPLQPKPVAGTGVTYTPLSSAGTLTVNSINFFDGSNPVRVILESKGDIRVHDIYSGGGDIALTSQAGAINPTTVDLNDPTAVDPNTYSTISSNGGAIVLSARGDINISGPIDSGKLTNFTLPTPVSGDGGSITITSTTGAIYTTGGFSISSGSVNGHGGAIVISAKGNIGIGDVDSSSVAGDSGDINVISLAGSVKTTLPFGFISSLSSPFGLKASSFSDRGGAVVVSAHDNISLNDVTTFSGLQLGGGRGQSGSGGTIRLSAGNDITTGLLNTTGVLGSGDIFIASNGSFSSAGSVITSDTFGSGKGGNIQISARSVFLTDGAQVSASTHGSGQGGDITIRVSDKVELRGVTPDGQPPGNLFAPGGLAGIPAGTYLGGFIPTSTNDFQQPNGTQYPSGLFTQTTAGATGKAGSLAIETGHLSIADRAAIAATTFGEGNAGDISVHASDSVSVTNGSILSGVAPGSGGNSGTINIQSRSLSVTGGGIVQTQTLGQGNAGAINVKATDAVTLSGVNATSNPVNASGLRSGSGTNSLLGTTDSNIGQGGNISVTTGNFRVADGAVVDAQTQTNSRGGNITVNANTLSAVNGGRLLTSTSDKGQAGDIAVNASELHLDGSSSGLFAQTTQVGQAGNLILSTGTLTVQNGAQVRAGSSGEGNGGNLAVNASDSVQLFGAGSGLFVDATSGSIAGNLTVATRQMTVSDGAQVTVSSPSGQAGNLTIQANSLRLNQGTLLAETGKSSPEGGANITLSGLDLLRLDNESLISANAFGQANGGNINVDSTFVVATPPTGLKGSDITANAGLGNGGAVNITTQGLFGIQFRPRLTPKNDITVSSDFGLSGTFQLNTPGIDPSRGVANLPATPVDASRQIAQGCLAGVGPRASKFVVTGRGGLPPNPQEVTRSESPLADLGTPVRNQEHYTSAEIPIIPTNSEPLILVEAQGWAINNKGEVVLTAPSSKVTAPHSWAPSSACQPIKILQ